VKDDCVEPANDNVEPANEVEPTDDVKDDNVEPADEVKDDSVEPANEMKDDNVEPADEVEPTDDVKDDNVEPADDVKDDSVDSNKSDEQTIYKTPIRSRSSRRRKRRRIEKKVCNNCGKELEGRLGIDYFGDDSVFFCAVCQFKE
jgi:hypothetical protein